MKMIKILMVAALSLAFASSAKAQFNSIVVPTQAVSIAPTVAGNSGLAIATNGVRVGVNGFSFMCTTVGTNAATTGTQSLLWRGSIDGTSTNTGAAVYTNTFAATGVATNRFYGTVPASYINGGYAHLTFKNGDDATNTLRILSISVVAQ